MSKLKPDFIFTARAYRRAHERSMRLACQGRVAALLCNQARKRRIWHLYDNQKQTPA